MIRLSFINLIVCSLLLQKCQGQQKSSLNNWHPFIAERDSMPIQGKKAEYYKSSVADILIPISINNYFKSKYKNLYLQLDLGDQMNLDLYATPFFRLLKRNVTIDTSSGQHYTHVIHIEKEISGSLSGYHFQIKIFFYDQILVLGLIL